MVFLSFKVSKLKIIITLFMFYSLMSSQAINAQDKEAAAPQVVVQDIESLKTEVIELNRDLFVLEEDLLFSANTQVSVFLSMDADEFFKLDSVQLKLDDKIVSNYLYTEREIKALKRGGVQRLYIGNLTSGEHELTAFFIGKGPSDRDYKRGTTRKINKSDYAKYIELKITGNSSKEQPDFEVKVWE
ncbi:MAG: AraC family transcriptional regulator [endosymbiont of Galathealinum brachiosum]|uniref:AraC family transcriptional regulator n=1 Tax=endosymbiont of Galathealinum brachiosum TaxID=2200906 RepID=A0A370DG34_9GAMM|nr:MAG: AraC family transcriptional regulator [endosymbiont of Galathealinum brachiosum]